VGKTELAKVLAEFLFGRKDALVRVDLSEFVEAHSLAKLIGSPPGYVGFGEGGQLTEAVRKRPFQVILFDEFEKAHPDVRNVLLQILDDGRLTDGKGRTVRFVDTVMIMTSNAGAHQVRRNIGFEAADAPDADAMMLAEAKQHFPPELWNRIDDKVVFHPLARVELERVARLMLEELSLAAFAEREVSLTFSSGALEYLATIAYDAEMGARPLRQTIQRLVEAKLADWVLRGELRAGECAHLCVDASGELALEKQAPSHAKTA
jgi:ATP-dependent Clp protease ATP-binding subunit ClpA